MLATVINGWQLKALPHLGVESRVMTAIDVRSVAEPFIAGARSGTSTRARGDPGRRHGEPVLHDRQRTRPWAIELECDVLMKATKGRRRLHRRPEKGPDRERYDHLTFTEAVSKNLGVMDMTALTMCQENNVPVLVFDFSRRATSVARSRRATSGRGTRATSTPAASERSSRRAEPEGFEAELLKPGVPRAQAKHRDRGCSMRARFPRGRSSAKASVRPVEDNLAARARRSASPPAHALVGPAAAAPGQQRQNAPRHDRHHDVRQEHRQRRRGGLRPIRILVAVAQVDHYRDDDDVDEQPSRMTLCHATCMT